MVAIIKTGHSIRGTFHYNENKLNEGVAEFILAHNYPMDQERMNEKHRLNMLLKTATTNENVKRNSVHISLNFAPGEAHSKEKLQEIAKEYMERIGFGNQPFLVYQHHDAGHPHIHIVSVKVRPDGTRIETQNIGRNQSEQARKAIEEKYGLVRAEDHVRDIFRLKPTNIEKAVYGKKETKKAIGNVLEYVAERYKFTSISELNAVLNMYNVHADRGAEDSRIYKNNGLVYRIRNEEGQLLGVPIKASDFHFKATLKELEKKFLTNHSERQKDKTRIKNAIDMAFKRNPEHTISSLTEVLKREGIHLVQRLNKDSLMYGITYVDHREKSVFNGSDLGKEYSANAMRKRCNMPEAVPERRPEGTRLHGPGVDKELFRTLSSLPQNSPQEQDNSLLKDLMESEKDTGYLPAHLRRQRRRKKRNKNMNPDT